MVKTKIDATIIADSEIEGKRITSFILKYPRAIHAELMTHRLFSRNAASSRAIPYKKMVEKVRKDPFIPVQFQKDHSGMQGSEYITGWKLKLVRSLWILGSKFAILSSLMLSKANVTKQLANRMLEPFIWYTVLVTATEYDNFFELRCPKYKTSAGVFKTKVDAVIEHVEHGLGMDLPTSDLDWLLCNKSGAEIHIQELAERMYDEMRDSDPTKLKPGEWHIPFDNHEEKLETRLKVAVARCARLSYETFDGEISVDKDLKLFDMLAANKHMSPFEHCARAMSPYEQTRFSHSTIINDRQWGELGWCRNFKGFIPYRFLMETHQI